MFFELLSSPVGEIMIAAERGALRHVRLPEQGKRAKPGVKWERRSIPVLTETRRQLAAYFSGRRFEFDLPLVLEGTLFQRAVWRELSSVPFAATISYGELARRVHRPNASRAVGAACSRNPLPIVVPCHRVVGKNGALVGFGGGLALKAELLALEAKQARL